VVGVVAEAWGAVVEDDARAIVGATGAVVVDVEDSPAESGVDAQAAASRATHASQAVCRSVTLGE
jgi:hypothetical protein